MSNDTGSVGDRDGSGGDGGAQTGHGGLTKFRTTWLRAVALSWVDKAFADALTQDPIKAIAERLGATLPWPKELKLVVNVEEAFFWDGDTWSWPEPEGNEREKLTLYVPLDPEKANISADKRVTALADYYDRRPSLFGNQASPRERSRFLDSTIVDFPSTEIAAFMENVRSSSSPNRVWSPRTTPAHDGLFPNAVNFMHFEVALVSIMAKAWENKRFRTAIQTEDGTAGAAFNTVRGYRAPWKLQVLLKNDNTAVWSPKGWTFDTPHKLELNLPLPPQKPTDYTLALAAYNATGAEYPFTCCA